MSGHENGNGITGKPSVILFETQSGVICHITPLNLATLRAIQLKAQDLFPYPDAKDYRLPLENAFGDDQTDKAENNPEYVALCLKVDGERARWADKAIFSYAVKFPKYPTHEDMINEFAPRLLELKKVAKLDEDSDYDAILNHLVLTWNIPALNAKKDLVASQTEFGRIIQLAVQTVALTPDEVSAGIRFFRPKV